VQNDPRILSKLKNKLRFLRSIEAIAVAGVKETLDARKVADAQIRALAPASKAKLVEKGMVVSNLTKKESYSFIVTFYAATEKL
jgi:hypothetical protein